MIARQSTSKTIMVGPVMDADGVAVTDGVVGDFKISKNGAAPAALNGSATLTHRHTGFYSLALTASDLDTVGSAQVTIDDTTNACPMANLDVIEEAVYDALYAASANTFTGAAGSSKVSGVVLTDTVTTYTGNTPQTGDSFARIGATGSGLTSLAPSATALSTAVWTSARAGYLDNINNATLAGASFPTDPADQSLIIAATDALATLIGDVPTNAELATALGTADDAVLAAIAALNNVSAASVATAVLTTQMTEAYAADGVAPTLAQAIFLMMQTVSEFSISGTTITVKKLDGSTTAATFTLNSATTPTSRTRAT